MNLPKPDGRDAHAYGGILLVAVGVGLAFGGPWGLVTLGAALSYLGIWRMG